MSRFDRFRKLEAPRTERPADGPRKTQERFDRVEAGRAPSDLPPPPPPPPGPAARRIERQVSDQPLILDQRSTQEQQFIRCMHCEGDNSRYASDCVHCGAALQTEAQRDFNERFWQQRQVQVAEEKQAVERFHKGREQMTKEQAEAQAAAYMSMVQEARGGELGGGSSWTPPGVRFIRSIENPNGQWLAIGGFVLAGALAVLGLVKHKPGQDVLMWACLGVLMVLGILFTPPVFWSSRG
ncbi:MAG TPA: hypothetical protein VFB81_23740, partial [Myxococcales bacterium]|nr:hypothetical protein [Myxococcales bacterium]